MKLAIPGQANVLSLPVVKRASGDPITTGTITFYLKALDGANAGKWWKGEDWTWDAEAQSAGAGGGGDAADGHWSVSIASAAWTAGVRYLLYAKESGALHIPVGDDVLCDYPTSAVKARTDLIQTGSLTIANPILGDQISLIAGDSYLSADGRQLAWPPVAWSAADPAGGTTKIRVVTKAAYGADGAEAGAVAEWAGAGADNGDGTVTFSAELTGAQTAALTSRPPLAKWAYIYQLLWTPPGEGADPITVAIGPLDCRAGIGAVPG
ncbi:MAG TPA: hypothetical protein VMY35_02810 [Phycisphaerae bacterium]|nr:hypothetical protein [Phycisphaerae bacterium]